MELEWPEFFITYTFQLHASTLMRLGNFNFIALGPFSRIRSQINRDALYTTCGAQGYF